MYTHTHCDILLTWYTHGSIASSCIRKAKACRTYSPFFTGIHQIRFQIYVCRCDTCVYIYILASFILTKISQAAEPKGPAVELAQCSPTPLLPGKRGCKNIRLGGDTVNTDLEGVFMCYLVYRSFKFKPLWHEVIYIYIYELYPNVRHAAGGLCTKHLWPCI